MNRPGGRPARGFTLVETLVAVSVAAVLFLIVGELYRGASVGFARQQRTLEAVQVAQVVLELLQSDVQAMIVAAPGDVGLLTSMAPRSKLAFLVSRPDQVRGGIYRAEPVTWELAPAAGGPCSVLVRNGRRHPDLTLKQLSFRPVMVEALDGRRLFYLEATVTACDGTGRGEVALVGVFALDVLTRSLAARNWNPNPYQYLAAAP